MRHSSGYMPRTIHKFWTRGGTEEDWKISPNIFSQRDCPCSSLYQDICPNWKFVRQPVAQATAEIVRQFIWRPNDEIQVAVHRRYGKAGCDLEPDTSGSAPLKAEFKHY